jgi:hypothetical protein
VSIDTYVIGSQTHVLDSWKAINVPLGTCSGLIVAVSVAGDAGLHAWSPYRGGNPFCRWWSVEGWSIDPRKGDPMKYLVNGLSKQEAKQYEIEAKDIYLHGGFVIFREPRTSGSRPFRRARSCG